MGGKGLFAIHAVIRAGGWVLFLEQAVNERRQGGTLRKNQHPAQQQKEHHDRRNPPFLLLAQKFQKLSDDRQSVHCLSRLAMVSKQTLRHKCAASGVTMNRVGLQVKRLPTRLQLRPQIVQRNWVRFMKLEFPARLELALIFCRRFHGPLAANPVARRSAIQPQTEEVFPETPRRQSNGCDHEKEKQRKEDMCHHESEHERRAHPRDINVFQRTRQQCARSDERGAWQKEIWPMCLVPKQEEEAQQCKDSTDQQSELSQLAVAGLQLVDVVANRHLRHG